MFAMQNIEEKIAQLRLAEAMQKDFFGSTGKLSIISKIFGTEIIQDNFVNNSVDFMCEGIEEEKINQFDINHTSIIIGHYFDGLKMGIPLEIIQKQYDNSLKVLWQNRVVYEEIDGELISFNPLNEWERNIENLYVKAEQKINREKNKNEKILKEEMQREEDDEIKRIKEKWGIF